VYRCRSCSHRLRLWCICNVTVCVYNHSVIRSVTADFAALFGYICLGLLFICIDGGATDNVCRSARCNDRCPLCICMIVCCCG